jgi:hypothetical protein
VGREEGGQRGRWAKKLREARQRDTGVRAIRSRAWVYDVPSDHVPSHTTCSAVDHTPLPTYLPLSLAHRFPLVQNKVPGTMSSMSPLSGLGR